MKQYLKTTCLLFASLLQAGCLAVAHVGDFPDSAAAIDFNKYAAENRATRLALSRGEIPAQNSWTTATSNEYYLNKHFNGSETELVNFIKYALEAHGYSIIKSDVPNKYLIAKRGMRQNEWGSLTGVYYKLEDNNNSVQVYIQTKITQDVTGGFPQNRAMGVGLVLQSMIDSHR